MVYYLASDGVSEYDVRLDATASSDQTSNVNTFAIDIDNDTTGLSGNGVYGTSAFEAQGQTNRRQTVAPSRRAVLAPGLHEWRPNFHAAAGTVSMEDESAMMWQRKLSNVVKL
jgi:hypothetical protein